MKTSKYLLPLILTLFFPACKADSGGSAAAGQQAANTAQPAAEAPPSGKQELMFVLADQTVSKGDTLCVDVQVRDFTNILSMQYSMNWDPKVLKFLQLGGINLKDLSQNNFGLNRTAQGSIGTSWFDYAVQGISIPDGTVIYKVCYQAVGEAGTKTEVVFSNEPVIIEISNSAEQLLGLAFKRANINIQ
ncbi:MAG: cohesin domain-containing protein [Saprospiraceae bacterium]